MDLISMANQKSTKQMRLLSLDIGSKRIGMALWNPLSQLASPLDILHRKTLKEDLVALQKILQDHKIEAVVVGVPTTLAGKETQSTQNSYFWIETLQKKFALPIYSFDESLSTRDAMDILREHGVKARSKTAREKKDAIAAALFLEEFIRAQE
jgi:putative Holliday junction resolvase